MTHTGLHRAFLAILYILIGVLTVRGATLDTELHHRIVNTRTSTEPFVGRDIILLSYEGAPGTQVVSLAMEHELYRKFHTFEKNKHGVFVLALPLPDGLEEIRYRLIVDGLWTTDPSVPSKFDERGVMVSVLKIPPDGGLPDPGIKSMSDGSVQFVYVGNPNSRVALVGDFNRWDPYLTPVPESPVHPGVYVTTLRLPPDSQYYRFVVNGRQLTDPGNPHSARNGWGEEVSVLR